MLGSMFSTRRCLFLRVERFASVCTCCATNCLNSSFRSLSCLVHCLAFLMAFWYKLLNLSIIFSPTRPPCPCTLASFSGVWRECSFASSKSNNLVFDFFNFPSTWQSFLSFYLCFLGCFRRNVFHCRPSIDEMYLKHVVASSRDEHHP